MMFLSERTDRTRFVVCTTKTRTKETDAPPLQSKGVLSATSKTTGAYPAPILFSAAQYRGVKQKTTTETLPVGAWQISP